MNTTETHAVTHPATPWALKGTAGGSFTEAVGAVGVIVLAVIGLAGILVHTLTAIATIVVGAAILIEGGAFSSSYAQFASRLSSEGKNTGFRAGLSAEFMGGVAGIVLGILALFGTAPETLLAVALIVFGVTFLVTSAALTQMNWLMEHPAREPAGEAARTMPFADATGQALAGMGALVLGILAVIGLSPFTLVLVGLLSLAAAALYNTSGYANRMLSARNKTA